MDITMMGLSIMLGSLTVLSILFAWFILFGIEEIIDEEKGSAIFYFVVLTLISALLGTLTIAINKSII